MPTKTFFSAHDLSEFIKRLHALVGLFIGPFIFVAALTGALYAMAFSLENSLYKETLFVNQTAVTYPLSQQVKKANDVVKNEGELFSVRPAADNETTRVLYTAKNLSSSEFRTIFIDPHNLNVTGDLVTYGSSSAMPIRKTIDLLHRDLMLGVWGRWYSELAASWLWITGFSGLFLFYRRTKGNKNKSQNPYQLLVTKHVYLGLFCFLGLIMLSITGLTWSERAGDNISKIRTAFHWGTPSVDRKLKSKGLASYDVSLFDKVEETARKNGISSTKIEIKPSNREHVAWQVSEIGKGFPTHADAIAIDPDTLNVTSKAVFEKFPLMAKLTRWGIDLHMGSLFGLANQILLIVISLAISILALTGYAMWFKRKGWRRGIGGYESLYRELKHQPILNILLIIFTSLIIGIILPLFGMSLIAFMLIEELSYVFKFYSVERN